MPGTIKSQVKVSPSQMQVRYDKLRVDFDALQLKFSASMAELQKKQERIEQLTTTKAPATG